MAGNLAATFSLGAVLGAGWVSSIGQAKKDISLLDRMSTGLNAKGKGGVNYDATGHSAANVELGKRREASDVAKSRMDANPQNPSLQREFEMADKAAREASASVKTYENQLKAQEYAAYKAGVSLTEYRKRMSAISATAASLKNLSRAVEGFRKSWGNATTLLRNSAFRVSAFVAGQIAIVGSVAKSGEAIHNQAAAAGMGVMAYQDLAYAAERIGVGNAAFDASLRKLNVTIGQAATSGGEAAGMIQRLGLSLPVLIAMPMEEKMAAIADSMKDVTDASERARIAQVLFGRGGGQLSEVLKGGAANMRALMQYGRDHSYTMTPEEVERSRQFSQTLLDTKNAFAGLKTGVGLAVMAPLAKVLKEIGAFVNANSRAITAFFSDLGTRAAGVFRAIWRVTSGVLSFVGSLLRVPGVVSVLVAAFATVATATAALRIGALARDLFALSASVLRAVPALSAYAAGAIRAALANKTLLAAGGGVLAYLGNFRLALLGAGAAGAKLSVLGRIGTVFTLGFKPVMAAVAALGGGFAAFGATATAALAPVVAAIASITWPVLAVGVAIAAVAFLVYQFWEPISGFFKETFSQIIGYFEPAIETLKSAWEDIVEAIEPLLPLIKVALVVALAPVAAAVFVIVKTFQFMAWTVSLAARAIAKMVRGIIFPFKQAALAIGAIWEGVIGVFTGNFEAALNYLKKAANNVIELLPEWLREKMGIKKLVITVDEKTKTGGGAKQGAGSRASTGSQSFKAIGTRAASPVLNSPPLTSPAANNSRVVNSSPSITINTQPGQDAREIAREVMRRLERQQSDLVGGSLRDAAY